MLQEAGCHEHEPGILFSKNSQEKRTQRRDLLDVPLLRSNADWPYSGLVPEPVTRRACTMLPMLSRGR